MKVSAKGIALIKQFEGCRLTAYRDTGNVLTVGWGHTGPDVKPGMTISQFEADLLLASDLEDHNISPLLGDAETSQNQFDAMSSLAFNIGLDRFANSTVLRRHKLGHHHVAANAFLLWVYDNGRIVKGLENRRVAERKLYLS